MTIRAPQISDSRGRRGKRTEDAHPAEFTFTSYTRNRLRRPATMADEALLLLVDDLREAALDVGDRLPSLPELSTQMGISISNVRAALQRLEMQGIVEVRRGRAGGITITGVAELSDVLSSIYLPLPEDQLPYLVEAWTLLEREVFLLASRRGSTADYERLDQAITELHQPETRNAAIFQELSFRAHTRAASMAGNQFLKRSFSELMNALGLAFAQHGFLEQFTPRRRKLALSQYDRLGQAVRDRDEPAIVEVVADRSRLQLQMMGLRVVS